MVGSVAPSKAGSQNVCFELSVWIPACAAMTISACRRWRWVGARPILLPMTEASPVTTAPRRVCLKRTLSLGTDERAPAGRKCYYIDRPILDRRRIASMDDWRIGDIRVSRILEMCDPLRTPSEWFPDCAGRHRSAQCERCGGGGIILDPLGLGVKTQSVEPVSTLCCRSYSCERQECAKSGLSLTAWRTGEVDPKRPFDVSPTNRRYPTESGRRRDGEIAPRRQRNGKSALQV